MRKIINDPSKVVDEMLEGYVKVHRDVEISGLNKRVVKCKVPPKDRVGIVTGGGSGHKPAFLGYAGKNMVDAVAIGEIFSSPPAKMFYDAFREADCGKGVACLYGNYAGDNMNVKMAMDMAEDDGIVVKKVVANDDVASAPKDQSEKRRGGAGDIVLWKVGGAKAAMGSSLNEVVAACEKALGNMGSMGVGLTPCTIPEVGHPNFSIEESMMEVGIGHHGEPGVAVTQLETAAKIAGRMCDAILPDVPIAPGDEVMVMVSGLGATPYMDMYIFYNEVEKILTAKGVTVYAPYVGNYFTSLEMCGITLSILKLDDELKECIDMETDSMGWRQFQR